MSSLPSRDPEFHFCPPADTNSSRDESPPGEAGMDGIHPMGPECAPCKPGNNPKNLRGFSTLPKSDLWLGERIPQERLLHPWRKSRKTKGSVLINRDCCSMDWRIFVETASDFRLPAPKQTLRDPGAAAASEPARAGIGNM